MRRGLVSDRRGRKTGRGGRRSGAFGKRRLRIEPLEERCLLAGGGQNILLVVNPGDENALRIANAYQELRGVPDSNLVFITPPMSNGCYQFDISATVLKDTYLTPIANAIASRGLTDQIDYIATLGQPTRYQITSDRNSFTYALILLDVLNAGLNVDNADHVVTGLYDRTPTTIAVGDNAAIYHAQHYTINYSGTNYDTQYYMAGALGYTWIRGNTADQVIQSLTNAVAADGTHPTGTIYFEDNDDIRAGRRYQWGRSLSVTAGTGTAGYTGDNSSATSATLNLPQGVAMDTAGNLFIADTANHCIRKVSTSGIITTVAGTGTAGYGGDDGAATSATLNLPQGIAVDSSGNLFIADTGNHCIRKIDYSTGVITTVAGTGTDGDSGDDGAATAARLHSPQSVAVDAAGNIYIADTANHRVRKVASATGTITTVAGTGTAGYGGDNDQATAAMLNSPAGVAVDSAGNLYIADTANHRVRRLDAATGIIATLAGTGTGAYAGDNGQATAASLNGPTGLAVDSSGNVYFSDTGNHRVRKVTSAGVIVTVAGTGTASYSTGNSLAVGAAFNAPMGVAVSASDYLYIADKSNSRVRRVGNDPKTIEMLTERGIPWVYEYSTSNYAPKNRTDVLGAVIGRAGYSMPNGSTYVAGSWADNLTSYGCTWDDRGQTKDSRLIAAGVAATSGSVIEPYLNYYRFTNSSIYIYQADGSTMGEAFAKSVATPDIQLFLGDLLSQPQADIPQVSITAGPADESPVGGTIAVSAAATLVDPQIATGVARLELLVDGKLADTLSGGSGTFNLNTTTLADGRHELRLVAVNNAAAESEGYTAFEVVVNNHGRSASLAGGDRTLSGSELAAVSVSATAGDGTVSRVELRNLGRTLGQVSGSAGTVSLDASLLAYGANVVTPVAVYSDGTETAGTPITVTRTPAYLAGTATSPTTAAGLKMEYFFNQGYSTIATSDFSGDPDLVSTTTKVNLFSGQTYLDANSVTQKYTSLDQTPLALATTDIASLALRITGYFNVSTAGEYQFYLWKTNDSAAIYVDGQRACGFDNAQSGATTNQVGSVYLGPGEHQVIILAANTVTGTRAEYFDISAEYRGPDGVTRVIDSTNFYTQINHAPTLASAGGQTLTTITEDATGNNGDLVSSIVGSTISDVDPRSVAGIALTAVTSGRGLWQYFLDGGTTWADVGSVSATQALLLRTTDRLRFVPDTLNADAATISYCAWDRTSGLLGTMVDSTANGGATAFSTTTDTAALAVLAANDAPAGADAATTIVEDATYTFALADFAFSDPIDTPAHALAGVKIATAPTAGSLQLDGATLSAGQVVSVAAIAAGRLAFVPAANATGSPYASFTFQVQDDGGTANGGVDLDPTPNTFTVSVTAFNDPPCGTDMTKSVIEDTFAYLTASDFGFTDPDDRPANKLYRVLITTLPASGTLLLSNVAVTAGQYVAVTDLNLYRLRFTPAANASGAAYTSFTFQVQDDGGTADLDPTPNTLSFNITAVNDAPAGSDATLTAIEDQAYAFAAADFGFTDPLDNPANALLAVKITSLPGAGSLLLAGAAVTVGQSVSVADINLQRLTFTAASNANGSPYTSFTFQVQDDGGTANLGADLDPSPNTLTFNVTAANDLPTIGALNATPDPVTVGQTLTLTAAGVSDSLDVGGAVVRVDFYCESNGVSGLQIGTGGDMLVGADTDGADGWSAAVTTTGWSVGSYTCYAQATDNEGGVSLDGTSAPATTGSAAPIYNLDADGNGTADALSDGILILRYLFDPAGSWNFADAVSGDATRTTRPTIQAYLEGAKTTVLDVDGNGTADALTDGILILRYLFDPTGSWSFADAVASDATRTTRPAIKAHLDLYLPTASGSRLDAAAPAVVAAAVSATGAVVEPSAVPEEEPSTSASPAGVAAPTTVEAVAQVLPAAATTTLAETTSTETRVVTAGATAAVVEPTAVPARVAEERVSLVQTSASPLTETSLVELSAASTDATEYTARVFAAVGREEDLLPRDGALDPSADASTAAAPFAASAAPALRHGAAVAFARARDAAIAAEDLFATTADAGLGAAGYDNRSMRTERPLATRWPSRSAAVSSLRLS
jgi:hypothetical protein